MSIKKNTSRPDPSEVFVLLLTEVSQIDAFLISLDSEWDN